MSFLAKVAKQIFDNHPGEYDKVLVVFNNRRAGLFLQRELQQLGDKPFFLPRIIGIDDFVKELGGLNIVPHEFLLFELYDIHRKKNGETEPFEDFMSLGEMMLNDFSEIDLYGVEADKILGNLYDLKRLGEWDISGKEQTEFQKRYLEFYNSLHHYYSELHRRLQERGEAFSGMAYRNVAENIDSLADKLEEHFVYFVGFNALSASESRIINYFVRQGKGKLVCDGDYYYYNDSRQEAGLFLRQNAEREGIDTNFSNHFADGEKTIHIVNCPENVLQTKVAGSIVETVDKERWGKGCAIVLSDEKLLMPMLNSLPASLNAINVTMGLPYSMSGVHNMVCKVLALHANRRDNKFYHTDIINLFSDNIISRLLKTTTVHSTVSKKLYEAKYIYASADEVRQLTKQLPGAEVLMFIFECDGELESLLKMLRHLIETVNESECLSGVVREQEALACMLQIVNYFEQIQSKYNQMQHIETLQRIYLRLAKHRSIALYGEPLKDIQLLGVLETRNLDFERIIILSVNEGTLPAGRTNNSLIPYTLKHAFGLPTHEEKDAVYAYNFYRLIQRAREVWLIYSSDAEGMGKGEPSRYILQIRNELASRFPNIKVDSLSAQVDNNAPGNKSTTSASKDERTMKRLREIAERGFSPSALNRYRNCPMLFYFNDVIGIREQDELSDEVESNELGTFIHDLLCEIYSRDSDKRIRRETLETALNELPDTIENIFRNEVLKGRSSEGKNRLYIEVAKMEVSNFLKKEIEKLKNHSIQMVLTDGLPIKEQLAVNQPFIDYPVNIEGITDRVDYYDGQLRIADYKSGGVEGEDLSVKDAVPAPRDPSDKWFQVMLYAWLFCRSHDYHGSFSSGIFPLRALSSDFLPASWEGIKIMDHSHIERFQLLLSNLLSELLNPAIDFTATPKKSACDFCPFNKICNI